MSLDVDLEELLRASQTFSNMGASYASAIGTMNYVSGIDDRFETGEVSGAWSSLVETLWGYLADSQDNLYDSSAVMINYINALCADDTTLATDLLAEIQDYNDALGNTGNGDDDLPDPLPEPDPNNPENVLPVPDNNPAARPGD